MPISYIKLICTCCNKEYERSAGHYNRAMKLGAKLFCSKTCFGLSRRDNKTIEEKKAEKAAYDAKYRKLDKVKAKKAEYFKRTYDPVKAAIERKKIMPRHAEYCRRPEYKAWKTQYDKVYRAKKDFGEFWEAGLVMVELNVFLESKRIKYESGQINKSQNRKRKWQI